MDKVVNDEMFSLNKATLSGPIEIYLYLQKMFTPALLYVSFHFRGQSAEAGVTYG